MDHIKLPGMDDPVSVFDICQAHQQLESDYNVDGWVRERPSNKRRMEATSCQLSRIGYRDSYRWVNICETDPEELAHQEPSDEDVRAFMTNRYVPEFLNSFPSWSKT